MESGPEIRLAGPEDAALILGADVFDGPVDAGWLAGFLAEPSHLLAVAVAAGRVVGFASAAVLHHPDKPPGLFIIELGVNEDWRRRGVATRLVGAIRAAGAAQGCAGAWVLTEGDNGPARALYSRLGAGETGSVVMFDWESGGTGEAERDGNG